MSAPEHTSNDESRQQTPGAMGSRSSTPGMASSTTSTAGPSRSSMTMSPTRPPYIPQFTAATQMILNRMKGESTSLTSALSTARSTINQTAYEDTKRQLLARMSTSVGMTMQMPAPPKPAALSSTLKAPPSSASTSAAPVSTTRSPAAGMSAIRKLSAGLNARGKPKAPPAPTGPSPAKKQRLANGGGGSGGGARAGRRKRGGKSNNNSDDSSLGSDSDSESKSAAAPTKTKSGRQVTKPTTYNPSAMEGSTRKRYGKRTAEQAMCKRCTRLAWNDNNQMVFCDGCEAAWHQRCHEPEIDSSVVADAGAKWYCAECTAKREKTGGKKAKTDTATSSPAAAAAAAAVAPTLPMAKSTWAGRTAGQKRAYLTGLSQTELISIIMTSIEQHPDLAIFPPDDGPAPMPRSLFAGSTTEGLFPRAEANPTGPINFVRKISAANDAGSLAKRFPVKIPGTPFDPDEEDPTGLMEAWPKPGHGMYHRLLGPDWEDETLVEDDYEAFSHIRYNDKGIKVWENGVWLQGEEKR